MLADPLQRLTVVEADITTLEVDAIVNAANNALLGGGGVDGAIHRAAGPGLLAECRSLGGCATGDAKITGGHHLKAAWVIHTVGPVWSGGGNGEKALLQSCYRKCFELVLEQDIGSVAFPAISAGVYGYPMDLAAMVAVTETRRFLEANDSGVKVVLVCFSDRARKAYLAAVDTELGRGLASPP